MKKVAILLTSLLLAFVTGCQDHTMEPHPEDIMAWRAGGPISASGRSIATDKNGYVYVAGTFLGTITLGSITLTSSGNEDIFLVKYTSNGEMIWAKRIGGVGSDYSSKIVVDDNGSIYMTGAFSGTVSFGSTILTSTTNGIQDIFIAKYNNTGEVQWARSAGGTGSDSGSGIAVDENGNVFVTGSFLSTANFGTITLTSSGFTDLFIAKYKSNGDIQWARKAGGPYVDSGSDIAISSSNNVYLIGGFGSSISFGPISLTGSSQDILIAKYNNNGDIQWAQKAGGATPDGGTEIAVDLNENVYITGHFTGSAMFGTTTLSSSGDFDVFVAKYNSNGEHQWAQRAGGPSTDLGNGISIDNSGNVYLTGLFEISTTFGSTTLPSSGGSDIFIAKYNTKGEMQWAQRAGGTSNESAQAIAVDKSNNFFITGGFQGTATFGTTTLTSSGDYDVFIAKYEQ